MSDPYADIADWAEDAYPPEEYNEYDDWKGKVHKSFEANEHFLPPGTDNALLEKWNELHPDNPEDSERKQKEIAEALEKGSPKTREIYGGFQELEKQSKVWSPKSFAKETGVNYNTARRELSEMVKSGILRRVSKGRYQLA